MPPFSCTRCGADNREGRRFCAKCGAGLPVLCAECGFANDATENYCGGCGVELRSADGESRAPFAPKSGDGERRPVTVLFADLVDYTRMSRSLDPEDVHALLGRYYDAADEIVERFGGSIDKHIGDSVMAVFGAPVAHGDDAIRAVRAAAEIHRTMPRLTGESEQQLAVHIGIASGEVVASGLGSTRHRAYTVIGNSVNLASRLLKLAVAGETVIDEAVHAAVNQVARCMPLEAVEIKGIETPVVAWRFVDFIDAADRGGAQPFVGRRAELAQLTAALESCSADGAGGAVLVRGEAGIGKSRLVRELLSVALARGFVPHIGRVLDFGMAKGRDAIREIVAGLLGLPPGSDAGARERALGDVLAQRPSMAAQQSFLLDLLDLPLPPERRALYEAMDNAGRRQGRTAAVVSLLEMATTTSPVLLVVEDVHWADAGTLEYLAALTRAVSNVPAVLAVTSRIEGDPFDPAWRASVQGSPLMTIDLGPLGAKDAYALVGGFASSPSKFAQRCVERAGGNPLFLEQLMRAADERDDHLPATLHSLVLARMDRLAERDRAALRSAAVIGQLFPLPLVRHLIQIPDYECTGLVASFLVRPEGDQFLFGHALIRDGVYASLTRTRRAELHRAAADWYGERDPELRAQHLDRAEAPEAPRAYLEAALAQAAALHPERAVAHAQRGAALARDPDDVLALNMLCGRLSCESGDGRPAVEAYTVALAAGQRPVERCRALIGIAAAQRLVAGVDEALAALSEAEPLARDNELARELAELHYIRGNLHFARGEVSACGNEHGKALEFARVLGNPEWEARAMSGLADAEYAAARMRSAFDRFAQCVALCDAHGLTRIAIPNRAMGANCRIYLMQFDEGIAEINAAHALSLEVADRHSEMFTLESLGLLLTLCARYDEAEPVLERALRLAEALGARRYEALLLAALAENLFAGGRAAEAWERNERALAIARDTGMRFCGPLALALRARMQDDARDREQSCAEAESLLAEGGVGHSPIAYHRLGAEDALARGEWNRALAHAAAIEAYTRSEPLPYADFLIARARVLAGLATRAEDPALRRDLARLVREAERVRWPIGWPAWAREAG